MKMRFIFRVFLIAVLVAGGLLAGDDIVTNETVTSLVKAGISDKVVIKMIQKSATQFDLGMENILLLKKAGVSDDVMAAMLEKKSAPAISVTNGANVTTSSPVAEIGVYYKKGDTWADLLPEPIDWKTGGWLKSTATWGMIKKDVNGHIEGKTSPNNVTFPAEFLIYAPEGVHWTEYQLLKLRKHKKSREFRTMTGGVINSSGGAKRDSMKFEGKKIAPRTYLVTLDSGEPGEYGFLPPGAVMSTNASGTLGKIYSFCVIE